MKKWLDNILARYVSSCWKVYKNKSKIYKNITANDSRSYLSYLNKLVHKYNKTYNCSIFKKPIDANYSALTEEIGTNSKSPKFKVGDRVRITKYNNIFSKGYTENWWKGIFVIDSVLKTNLWTYKIRDFIGDKIIQSFYERELLLSKLWMSYYPEPDNHIRDKVKVVLDLSSYATKKN